MLSLGSRVCRISARGAYRHARIDTRTKAVVALSTVGRDGIYRALTAGFAPGHAAQPCRFVATPITCMKCSILTFGSGKPVQVGQRRGSSLFTLFANSSHSIKPHRVHRPQSRSENAEESGGGPGSMDHRVVQVVKATYVTIAPNKTNRP